MTANSVQHQNYFDDSSNYIAANISRRGTDMWDTQYIYVDKSKDRVEMSCILS